jgi:phosphatidylserine decarboxylase
MSKTLRQWLETEVNDVSSKSLRWLSEQYFFRDPARPIFSDSRFFYPPADGIILYAKQVLPDQSIIDIKGKSYSLQTAMRDKDYDRQSLVIGIFMTFYDVHINRIPYAGRLSYKELESINTYNYPMIDVEKDIINDIKPYTDKAEYLFNNQRVLNRIYSIELQQHYYVLQVADYDVDCITPFRLKQNQPFAQNQRFSQIRYGSQVDLIIPLSERYEFKPLINEGMHVEAGVDPLVEIIAKGQPGGLA